MSMIWDWYERQDTLVRWWFAAVLTPFILIAAAFVVVALVWLLSIPHALPTLGFGIIAVCLVACVHQVLEDM